MSRFVRRRRIAMLAWLALFSGGWLPDVARCAQPPAVKPWRIQTVDDRTLSARILGIADGRLRLEGSPPEVALADVAQIEADVKPALSAVWMGQQPSAAKPDPSAKSGTAQTLYISLQGLPASDSISQIVIRSGSERWNLHSPSAPQAAQGVSAPNRTSPPAGGPIVVGRVRGSDMADLSFDGSKEDYFKQLFTISVTLDKAGVQTTRLNIATHTKTDAQAAVAKPADASALRAILFLKGADVLSGQLLSLGRESLKLRTRWQAELEIPLAQIRGVRFLSADLEETRELFERHLAAPGSQDVVIARGKDQSPMAVAGRIESLADGKLQMAFEDQLRPIQQSRLAGLVFAGHSETGNKSPNQTFELWYGDKISGIWTGVGHDAWQMRTSWGSALRLPPMAVARITFLNGKLVYLSSLQPAAVDEVPYFDYRWHYRRDENLVGGSLRVNGETFAKGLAVHARSALTYALDADFGTFKATVGFDESRNGLGRVACRVLGDGKVLYSEKDLRGDQKPVPLSLSVAGVRKLTLEVDFGEEEDTGDRIIWGNARLLRKSAP